MNVRSGVEFLVVMSGPTLFVACGWLRARFLARQVRLWDWDGQQRINISKGRRR